MMKKKIELLLVEVGEQRVHVLVVELSRVRGVTRHPRRHLLAVALHARPPHQLPASASAPTPASAHTHASASAPAPTATPASTPAPAPAHAQLHEVRTVGAYNGARHQVATKRIPILNFIVYVHKYR